MQRYEFAGKIMKPGIRSRNQGKTEKSITGIFPDLGRVNQVSISVYSLKNPHFELSFSMFEEWIILSFGHKKVLRRRRLTAIPTVQLVLFRHGKVKYKGCRAKISEMD
ncbi:MAG: hypothetical protein NTY07_19710 [Bacteroidia bacterium]|nr:hypothetical protein [Bacteroidia bacterium]